MEQREKSAHVAFDDACINMIVINNQSNLSNYLGSIESITWMQSQ